MFLIKYLLTYKYVLPFRAFTPTISYIGEGLFRFIVEQIYKSIPKTINNHHLSIVYQGQILVR
ncbi:hypothetical protein [Flavobacterium sp.]|uniref:hypothetical protein n=1 Tax=Flavobacterium sp. TaxID=239 RepID=UPI00286D7AFE|nr:hypothetical protein [Flavobacterium sp.]